MVAVSRSSPRVLGQRTCRMCKERQPLAAFAEGARSCTACVEARPITTTRQTRNRARNRAYVLLAQAHPEEFSELYQAELAVAKNEDGIRALLTGKEA